jgi:hypothetical protein
MDAILDLQSAVSAGFVAVDRRFDRVEYRLTNLEAEVAGIGRWTIRADERFARIEGAIFS